jgi:hypothetical protein
VLEATAVAEGPVDAFFMWWDLKMDPEEKITLSCAPEWAHPNPKDMVREITVRNNTYIAYVYVR